MSPVLIKHGGKIVFGVTLVACGAVWATYLSQTEPQEFSQLNADSKTLDDALAANKVSPNYHYTAENVKYTQAFKKNAMRLEQTGEQPVAYAVYPKLTKPT